MELKKLLSLPQTISLIVSNLFVLVTAFYSNIAILQIGFVFFIEVVILLFFYILKAVIFTFYFGKKVGLLKAILDSVLALFFFGFVTFLFMAFVSIGGPIPSFLPTEESFLWFIGAVVVLFINDLVSFVTYFKKDYSQYSSLLFWTIAPRPFIMHLAVILGVVLGLFFGNFGQGIIVVFVLLKISFDFWAQANIYKN